MKRPKCGQQASPGQPQPCCELATCPFASAGLSCPIFKMGVVPNQCFPGLAAYLLNHPGDCEKCLCLSLTPRKSRSRGLGCNLDISMFPRAPKMTRTCGQGRGASAEVISC